MEYSLLEKCLRYQSNSEASFYYFIETNILKNTCLISHTSEQDQ